MPEVIGNTLKETQEQLTKLLGFDYETFRNTANFEQGGSDSFSALTPKDAKLVVMKILQLSKFEQLEKICREKYRVLFEKGSGMKTQIEFMEKNLNLKVEDEAPYSVRKEQLTSQLQVLTKDLEEVRQMEEHQANVNRIKKGIEQINSLDECPTCRQHVSEDHKKLVIYNIQKAITELEKTVDYNILDKTKLIKDSYTTTLTDIASNDTNLLAVKNNNIMIRRLVDDKQNLEKELNIVKEELGQYKNLIEAFGKNGIPSYIIQNTIPEITGIANDILQSLEVDFQVEIDTEKVLKTGEISDTLNISIRRGKYVRKYFNYSGGEKFLIDLSLRIALSLILLRRKGCNNSTLIIDEGLGALDKTNCPKVIKLINLVQERYGFQKVLLITHVEDIQDAIQNKITIVKHDTYSDVKL